MKMEADATAVAFDQQRRQSAREPSPGVAISRCLMYVTASTTSDKYTCTTCRPLHDIH